MRYQYNRLMSMIDKVEMEKELADLIKSHPGVEMSEEAAQYLGKEALYCVLRLFRPDLFDEKVNP